MINKSKCKTKEELYDTTEIEYYKSGLPRLEYRIETLEMMLRSTKNHLKELEAQRNKYIGYISAYNEVYPNRPWEDIE